MTYHTVQDCTGMTDEEISDMSWDLGIDCAESFGDFYGEDTEAAETECDDMFRGARNFTNDDIDTYWEEYNPEEHDALL